MSTLLRTLVEPLKPEQSTDFLALNRAAFPAQWGERWGDQDLLDAIALPGVTLCVARGPSGSLVGFLMARRVLDEAEILLIGVLPEERGRGVATTLLNDFIKKGRLTDLSKVFLEVRETNNAALSLYEGLGFQAVGRREKYYRSIDGSAATAITLARYLRENQETL